jgi:hypothetical protein
MHFSFKAVVMATCLVLSTIKTVNGSPMEEVASLCCDQECNPATCGDVSWLFLSTQSSVFGTNFVLSARSQLCETLFLAVFVTSFMGWLMENKELLGA